MIKHIRDDKTPTTIHTTISFTLYSKKQTELFKDVHLPYVWSACKKGLKLLLF